VLSDVVVDAAMEQVRVRVVAAANGTSKPIAATTPFRVQRLCRSTTERFQ